MLDRAARAALQRPLEACAAALDRPGITPDRLTLLGLAVGLASALLAAQQLWLLSAVLWLISRVLDGLDGQLARRRRAGAPATNEAGGFLDIVADFIVYGATVLGVAVGATTAFGAPWWPFLLVLFSYYVNGAAFLAFSGLAERTGRQLEDGRSFSFLGRIAEGTETILIHTLWLLVPALAAVIAVAWAVFVMISATHRVITGYRLLS